MTKTKNQYWATLRPIKAEIPQKLRQKGRYGEWVLQGFQANSGTPIWRYNWDRAEAFQKYPPARMKLIRSRNGVGRPPERVVIDTITLDTSEIKNPFAAQ